MQKIVYDKRTGNEVVLDASDVCPVSGRWLIPSKCTESKPPKKKDGYELRFEDGKWSQVKTEEQEEAEAFQKAEPVVKSLEEKIEELTAKVEALTAKAEELTAELERVEQR